MLQKPEFIIDAFVTAMNEFCGKLLSLSVISHAVVRAPHAPPDLPAGKCAVYVFSLCAATSSPAGPGRVLKVGRVGANSGPRFKYQHYKRGSANSTLAGALENNRLLWKYLGLKGDVADFGQWLKLNTDRDHFFVDASQSQHSVVALLEVYLKAVLGPVFEGSLKNHSSGSE